MNIGSASLFGVAVYNFGIGILSSTHNNPEIAIINFIVSGACVILGLRRLKVNE